jgi:hypothetical protein
MSKSYRRKNKIAGQFSARTIEMMESPAFCTLGYSARRVLDRIEIEHAHHGGNDKGQLPVTYNHFIEYGIHHHAVAPAIREAEALGFIDITEQGRAGNAQWRRPNKFRLTYRHTGRANPTDEWRKIKTIEEAKMVVQAARTRSKRKHFPLPVGADFTPVNRQRKRQFHTPPSGSTGHTPPNGSTSIFRGGGGGSGGCLSSEGCPEGSPPADGFPVLSHDRQPFLDEIAAVIARELDKLAWF